MAVFASDGLEIAYDDIGDPGAARALVLVHGFASNRGEGWRRTGWYGAIERRGGRVVALDLRGHGQSSRPHDPAAYARAAMAADVERLIEHLGLWGVDLFGYSMGAGLALRVAAAVPERLRNLVLGGVGARALAPREDRGLMAQAMTVDDARDIAHPMLRGFRQFADAQGEDRLALAACSSGGEANVDVGQLGAVYTPTLVVAGARDGLAGAPEPLAELIPGARAVTLPACDHFSAIPHALLKAAVFDWLDGWAE